VKKLSNEYLIQWNFYNAYYIYHKKKSAISFKFIEYFDVISYNILQDDGANTNIKIRIGDAIDIEEDNEIKSHAYAIIWGIFTHIANDRKRYTFLIIDWYYDTGHVENFTESKIYDLQESDDDLWSHIHSFHIIDQKSCIHFIYNCKASYVNDHHIIDNLEYLHNEFFYMAV